MQSADETDGCTAFVKDFEYLLATMELVPLSRSISPQQDSLPPDVVRPELLGSEEGLPVSAEEEEIALAAAAERRLQRRIRRRERRRRQQIRDQQIDVCITCSFMLTGVVAILCLCAIWLLFGLKLPEKIYA